MHDASAADPANLAQIKVISIGLAGGALVAMIMGTVMAIVIGPILGGQSGAVDPMLVLIFAGLLVALTTGSFIGQAVLTKKNVAEAAAAVLATDPDADPAPKITAVYTQLIILRMALLEGPAMLAGIAVFLTGQFALLAVGVLLLAVMATVFPTPARYGRFVDRVIERAQRSLPAA